MKPIPITATRTGVAYALGVRPQRLFTPAPPTWETVAVDTGDLVTVVIVLAMLPEQTPTVAGEAEEAAGAEWDARCRCWFHLRKRRARHHRMCGQFALPRC